MENKMNTLEDLVRIIRILRGENGCPWDRVQTHASIRMDMLEEAYEAADAIDGPLLCEVIPRVETLRCTVRRCAPMSPVRESNRRIPMMVRVSSRSF